MDILESCCVHDRWCRRAQSARSGLRANRRKLRRAAIPNCGASAQGSVEPPQGIEATPWPEAITPANTYGMPVGVRDALGRARTNVRVRWRTTNQSAFTTDSTTGTTTAVGLFGGEVIVTAGESPFQVTDH